MKTTYEFTSADGAPVYCPFSKLLHLACGAEPGHLLVFDDEKRVLTFLHARTKLGVAGNVFLTGDADLKSAKDWIAEQVAAKHLSQVGAEPPESTTGLAAANTGGAQSKAPIKAVATDPPQDSSGKKTASTGL